MPSGHIYLCTTDIQRKGYECLFAELGDAFGSHIPMYNRYSEEKVGMSIC